MPVKDPSKKLEEYKQFIETFSNDLDKINDINFLQKAFNNFKTTNNKYVKDFRTFGNQTAYTAANICSPVVKKYLTKLKTFTK